MGGREWVTHFKAFIYQSIHLSLTDIKYIYMCIDIYKVFCSLLCTKNGRTMNSEKVKFHSVQMKQTFIPSFFSQQILVEDWQCARHCFEFFWRRQNIKLARELQDSIWFSRQNIHMWKPLKILKHNNIWFLTYRREVRWHVLNSYQRFYIHLSAHILSMSLQWRWRILVSEA